MRLCVCVCVCACVHGTVGSRIREVKQHSDVLASVSPSAIEDAVIERERERERAIPAT